ncbi:unnamed protein product [Penicillium pancosmium]
MAISSTQDDNATRRTDLDDLELESVGYRREMPRQFSIWSLGALSFTLTCTWLGTGSSVGIALQEGSYAGTLWSLPIAGTMTTIVSVGMAELASAYPVAGAQYYWAFMVASDDWKAFASYLNAWMSIIGWWLGAGSVANFVSGMVLDIVLIWYPSYSFQHWHQYLIYVAIIWLAVSINILASRLLPLFNKLIFILSVFTLAGTTITLFIVSRQNHAPLSSIFADTSTHSGWKSDGFGFMLAVSNAVFAFLGSDCGAHLCEEIHNPSRNVPMVIVFPLIVGLVTAFPFACALMYSVHDLTSVLNSVTGLPLIEIYFQGTNSTVAASVLLSIFAFCFFGCLVANVTTCSRTLWAVSRDGAIPFGKVWMRVHRTFQMPSNAALLSGTCVTIYGVIFIGSTTAFSSMVNAAIVFQQTSCIIPQAIVLLRGRSKVLPERYFNLGIFGAPINAIAVAWVLFLDVLYCFPTSMPVTPQNMSYVSVVTVGLVSFVIILWFLNKRNTFKGPNVDYNLLNMRRMANLRGEESTIEGTNLETGSVNSQKIRKMESNT